MVIPGVVSGDEPDQVVEAPENDQRQRRGPHEEGPDAAAAGPRKRRLWAALIVLFWVMILVGAVALGISLWVRRTFGFISVDQLLTNMPGGGGEGAGGSGLVVSGLVTGILIPAVVVLLIALLAEWGRRRLLRAAEPSRRERRIFRASAWTLAVVVPLTGVAHLGNTIGMRDYVIASVIEATTGQGLQDYYVAPKTDLESKVGVATGASAHASAPKPNLILIYLESMEDAFSDEDRFEKDMLAPLDASTEGWATIPKLRQYEGGGWTMSGIVSTQCGIPLRTASSLSGPAELNEIGNVGKEVAEYLPGATCLGDVLADEGYRNVYLGGADARFAGKGAFLSSHGYSEVNDLSVWKEQGETEVRDDWGLSDRRLFDRAKETVSELHATGEPFNLTMLTLDTHEGPRVYDYCDWDTEVAMTSITYCSMQQVSGFVDYLGEQGILEDTVVVLMGDHQKLVVEGGNFYDELKDDPDRSITNRIWTPDPGAATFARPEVDQFAMYPTLLELLGIEIRNHRAGIGVSALVAADEVAPGSVLDLDDAGYRALVSSRSSDFFGRLWDTRAAG